MKALLILAVISIASQSVAFAEVSQQCKIDIDTKANSQECHDALTVMADAKAKRDAPVQGVNVFSDPSASERSFQLAVENAYVACVAACDQ